MAFASGMVPRSNRACTALTFGSERGNGEQVAELLAVAKRFLIDSLSVSQELLVGLRGSSVLVRPGR